jgi:sirohydrochlorin cobaltochelatase
LLIAGHGTRSDAGAEQFRGLVERVRARAGGIAVAGGFIELSSPPLADAVGNLLAAGHTRVAAVPLTLVAAGHAKGDIPGALARERERHPRLRYSYGRPLGPHPALLSLLDDRLAAVCPAGERAGTTVLLVGRGSTDPDANAEVHKVSRLLWEGRDLAGVEPAFISLAAPGVPAGLERCRRLGAGRIVVLPYFLFDGVLPDRVVTQARAWALEHPGVDVRVGGLLGTPVPLDVPAPSETIGVARPSVPPSVAPPGSRSSGVALSGADRLGAAPSPAARSGADALADLVLERYREAVAGDIRMSCDTCMYRVALAGFEHRVGEPQHPHDHPDDPIGGEHPHDRAPAGRHGPGHARAYRQASGDDDRASPVVT